MCNSQMKCINGGASMRAFALILTLACAVVPVRAHASELAPTGALRATFIATNPVQARVDAATGEVRGPAADLTRALALKLGLPFTIKPAQGVAGVIDSVKSGAADIGFIAYDATRAEQVDFSQTYLLAHNSYIVPRESALRTVADVDRPGARIGVGERDAGDLFLTRNLKSAELKRMPSSEIMTGIRMLAAGELEAYAANRTRLIAIAEQNPGLRLLPDNFYSVEQAITVAKGNAAGLGIVDRFIAEARTTGLIQAAIDGAGLKGVDVAPASTR
jgi:polar amino acid transport system substrate-binding protein